MPQATESRFIRLFAACAAFLILDFGTACDSAAGERGGTPPAAPRPGDRATPIGPLERGGAAVLDRMAFAVDGAESSHGADPKMWRAEPDGPQGPMQVTAAAASDVGGGDRFDGQENRALGRAYLAHMYRRYGTWLDAVAAYNWGPGHMDSWISGGRPFDKLPPAVERYRIRVLYGSALGALRPGNVHLQPRRPAADPHNGRGAVELLYPEIMRASSASAEVIRWSE